MKICSNCKEEKELIEFGNDKYTKDKLTSQCKKCRNKYGRSYNKTEAGKKAAKKHRKSDKRKKYLKEYYSREDVREKRKEWERNYIKQPHIRKKRTDYMRERKKVDELFRLRSVISAYIANSIRGINSKKGSSIDILGCSIENYKDYLSDLFTEGMNWDNYGDWHIDHKRPVSSFDLSKDEDVNNCFHYSNTQPLWAEDNLIKGSKWNK